MAEADDSSRVGIMSHAVKKQDLKPGDHIYCHRGIFYNHHGIYIGEPGCEVIHFCAGDKHSSSGASSRTPLGSFSRSPLGSFSRSSPGSSSGSSRDGEGQLQPDDSERAQDIEQEVDEQDQSVIESTTLVDFLYGSTLRLVSYDSSAWKKFFAVVSSHYVKAMPPSETIKLAKHFLDHPEEWGNYHLKNNNCETFACFCKTGHMNLAAQLNQLFRNVFSEMKMEPSCETAEEALRKYREQ